VKTRAAAAILLLAAACRGGNSPKEAAAAPAGEKTTPSPTAPTAVRVAAVARATLPLTVSAPGHTAALTQQKLRAPFTGTLTELKVADGDPVARGQSLGTIVARESEAALSGAREMLRQAATPAEKSDAERALALAQRNLVRKSLVASWNGAVISHTASAGDRVAEDQEILTMSDSASLIFVADVPQTDLNRIRPGQKVTIEIAGARAPIAGAVHALLPGANPADFTGQIRVDLGTAGNLPIGLFGTARILVGERAGVAVVPDAAILRDDVSGVSRVCLAVNGKAHWIDVTPGAKDSGRTEIVSPPLSEGQAVIVSGLVGLPEGKTIAIEGAAPAAKP
jgi:multidrug efflux pump subunit AcrA (membrane-fusion protein)